ncbi:MAG: acyl-CoA dehydrogenase family protein, partial [Actinomycetes bacterium]
MSTLDERLGPVLDIAATHAAAVDTDGEFPEASVQALRDSGLLGLTLPTEVGGLGAGPVEFSDVTQRLAAACGSTAMIYLMHVSAAMPIASAPPGLPGLVENLASGAALGTLGFSERGSRSHFWAPVSKAEHEGGGIRLRADKSWVTSASWADTYLMSTRSADGDGPTDTDLYVLGRDTEGLKVAAPWVGMGLRGNASSPMTIDTLVDESSRVGEAGSGFATMMNVVLPWFNLGNASVTLGLAKAALDGA